MSSMRSIAVATIDEDSVDFRVAIDHDGFVNLVIEGPCGRDTSNEYVVQLTKDEAKALGKTLLKAGGG